MSLGHGAPSTRDASNFSIHLEAAHHRGIFAVVLSVGDDIPCAKVFLSGTHSFSLRFLPELQESRGGGDPGSCGHGLS